MQYQVPQFIESEDKIIGPLTLKQFLYLAAAGGISFACFFFLKTWLWLIITLLVGIGGAALAFININGQPLPKVIIAAMGFYWKPRLYLWQKVEQTPQPRQSEEEPTSFLGNLKQQLTTSRAPIPKREKPGQVPVLGGKENFETLRKITGEQEKARRVDYR